MADNAIDKQNNSVNQDTDKQNKALFKFISSVAKAMSVNQVHCPSCDQQFSVNMVENLDPYSITYTLTPSEGRLITGRSLSRHISAYVDLIEAVGDDFGHEIFTAVSGLGFDKKTGKISVSIAILPRRKPQQTPKETQNG